MRDDVGVQIVKGDAFQVSYLSNDAKTAMKVTERLASLFIEENLRDREGLAEGANQFLESQLDDARRKLVEHETKLAEYKRQYNGELPSQTQSNLQVIGSSQSQVQGLSESINRDRDRRLMLERMLADANVEPGREPAGGPRAPAPADAGAPTQPAPRPPRSSKPRRAQLRAVELRLKPEHPDVMRMKRAIRDLEKKAEAEALQAPISPEPAPPPSPRSTPAARTRSAICAPRWRTSISRLRTRRRPRPSWKRRSRPTSTASKRRRAVSWT